MASSTESLTAPGPSGSSLYESTSNADLENRSNESSSEFILRFLLGTGRMPQRSKVNLSSTSPAHVISAALCGICAMLIISPSKYIVHKLYLY